MSEYRLKNYSVKELTIEEDEPDDDDPREPVNIVFIGHVGKHISYFVLIFIFFTFLLFKMPENQHAVVNFCIYLEWLMKEQFKNIKRKQMI